MVFIGNRGALSAELPEGIQERIEGGYGQIAFLLGDAYAQRTIFGRVGEAPQMRRVTGTAADVVGKALVVLAKIRLHGIRARYAHGSQHPDHRRW